MALPIALVRALIVAFCAAVLAFAPAKAQEGVASITITTTTISWGEDDGGAPDAADEEVAAPDDDDLAGDAELAATRRYAPSAARATSRGLAAFGPFTVIDAATVRMAGDVTSSTPRAFAAMMAAFPGLKRIEMVDCPGSLDEEANLILARAIRRARLETTVPAGGSVRSGAVELWLAGIRRTAAPDAEFGVHSWADEYGREAGDYPADDPVHAEYLGYYREMGMDDASARAFYALTNSTPFDEVRTLTRADMARFVPLD